MSDTVSTTSTQASSQSQPPAGAQGAVSAAQAMRPVQRRNTVTVRAILVGLVLCGMAGISFPYAENVVRGTALAEDHTAIGVTAMFFLVVLAGNGLARWMERRSRGSPLLMGTVATVAVGAGLYGLARLVEHLTTTDAMGAVISTGLVTLLRVILTFAALLWGMLALVVFSRLVEAVWAGGRWLSLNRAEMLTIFAMLLISSALVTSGLAMELIPVMPAVGYYTLGNNIPDLPGWMRMTDANAYKGFFEGIQRMPGFIEPQTNYFREPFLQTAYETWTYLRQIPWSAWTRPLLGWTAFLVPLYTFSICLMVIIRGQWMDREILVYPLTRLPQEMTRVEDESPQAPALGPLFRNNAMWLGFVLPVVFASLRAIHAYYMGFPEIKLEWQTKLMSDQITLWIVPSFVAMGFTYLVNTRISFSVWTLSLTGMFLSGWLALRGYKTPENLAPYFGATGNPLVYHMGTGALLTMSVVGLWAARRHLGGVLRKAFTGDPRVDDSKEILSYRWAVILAVVCAAVMLAWLIAIGMQWWVALFFWTTAMLIFYGLTRIVAEAGLGAATPPGIAPVFTVSKLGASSMAGSSTLGLGLQFPYAGDIRTFVMAGAANSLKLTQEIEHRRRRLFLALFGAVLVSLVVSVGTIIYMSYVYQGTSLDLWYYRDVPKLGLDYAREMIVKRPGPNVLGWVYSGVGVVLMGLLMTAQRRFLRWPIHPIGLVMMGTWALEKLWISIFLAWLIKSLVLKYGGPRLYMRTIPFFLGMILGQCVSSGTWCIVDYVTGVVGNSLFTM